MILTMTAWYQKWFGQDYLELYSHRDEQEAERHVDFVDRFVVLPEKPSAVLDLACGAGRHTAALRRRGYRALGVDLSLTLLAVNPDLPKVAGDMRRLPFADGSFDCLLNFFTSFGYFESERENFLVLEEIVRLLAPGGRFMMDFFNAQRVVERLEPRESSRKGDKEVEIERWYDEKTRRINKRISIRQADRDPRVFLESVRAYRAEEVTIGMQWAGLEVSGVYGDFDGRAHDTDSERLIVVGRRPS